MKIVNLADNPEFLPFVARWHFETWDHQQENWTLAQTEAKIRHCMGKRRLPMTFVAVEGNTPLGTGSLWLEDWPERKDLAPWLAALFVSPEHRRKGVASELIRFRLAQLGSMNFTEAYIWSSKDNLAFHRRFGWQLLDDGISEGIIMYQDL
jgi:GNAT superfamily N-acetyltransferase